MGNKLKIDVTGKRIVVKDGLYNVGSSEADRTFLCENGFGCVPYTSGQAIFGRFVESGIKCRIEGYEIEKLAEGKNSHEHH